MHGVFNKYQWDAPIYKTYAEATRALENFQIKEKKIKHIHAIGNAENMETWSHIWKMRRLLHNDAGIPYEDIDSGTYPYIDLLQFPCEVELCEPIVFVFEDDTTLEILPHANHGLQMSVNKIGKDVVDGLNHSNFDSDQLFDCLKGHSVRNLQIIVKTLESWSNTIHFDYTEKRTKTTYQFWLDGEYGFYFRQPYPGYFSFGVTMQNHFAELGNETATVSYGKWKAVRNGLTQIVITEGHGRGGYFHIMPVAAEESQNTSVETDVISLDEDEIFDFLYFFLKKYYDPELNRKCRGEWNHDEDFDWYGDNYFSYAAMKSIVHDIEQYAEMIRDDYKNPLLAELKKGFHASSFDQDYSYTIVENRLPDAVIIETNRHIAVDFYQRFANRMRSMMQHAPQCELICFTGP